MDITQKITLDLDRRSVYTAICAKQGDEKSRKVQITLVSGGAVYKAPSGRRQNSGRRSRTAPWC